MNDDQYLGQIMLVAGTYAPRGYVECNGQLLQVSQHGDLFKLLSNMYGGDGKTTFAVPDLRGRVVCGPRENFGIGATVGIERNPITIDHMTAHTHNVVTNLHLSVSSKDDRDSDTPVNCYLSLQDTPAFSKTQNAKMGKIEVDVIVAQQGSPTPTPIPNIMPSLPMIFCMSLEGRFPDPD